LREIKKIIILILLSLLFLSSCSARVEEKPEVLKKRELEAPKQLTVQGISTRIKNYYLVDSMFVPFSQKGTEGSVFPQVLPEEFGLESIIGVERFVPTPNSEVYLVDHPPTVNGARVQKFSFPDGKLLLVRKLKPSTLFTTNLKGEFIYHHPQGVYGSEGLVVVENGKGGIKERIKVPPDINVGEIYSNKQDIWVLQESYLAPPRYQPGEDFWALYYPALVGLKTKERIGANYMGWDGNFYFFGNREIRSVSGKPFKGNIFLFGPIKENVPEKKFVFPWEIKLVGVDKKGYIYVLREREFSFEADSENRSEYLKAPRFVYRVSPEGRITHLLNIESFIEPSMYKKFYVWVGPEGEIWSLSESSKGVEIKKFLPNLP